MRLLQGEQVTAYNEIMDWIGSSKQFFSLSAPAGTGKTWLVKYIKSNNPHIKIILTAMTNKAADVLSNGLDCEVKTLHSLLRMRPPAWAVDVRDVHPNAIVIVDEASMMSSSLLAKLLQTDIKFLFVGDPYQLPPVNEQKSLALTDITGTTLSIIRRTNNASILDLSVALRDAMEGRAKCPNPYDFFDVIKNEHTENDSIYIAYTNKNCIDFANRAAAFHLGRVDGLPCDGDMLISNDTKYIKDEKVFFNGQSIMVEGVKKQKYGFSFAHGGREYASASPRWRKKLLNHYSNTDEYAGWRDALVDMRWPYSCTAHKAQGSEYNSVVVDVGDILAMNEPDSIKLRLLYVAFTRGTQSVKIYA